MPLDLDLGQAIKAGAFKQYLNIESLNKFPELTLKEVQDLGLLNEKDIQYLKKHKYKKVYLSQEAIIDHINRTASESSVRTSEITEAEIIEWQEASKMLDEMDMKAAQERVFFLAKRKLPYQKAEVYYAD